MTTNKINLDSLNVNPSGGGIFGFGNFAETWNGRMAMIGFAAALVSEVLTGKGILGQIGITSPGGGILVALFLTGFTVATTIGYYAIKLNKVEETEPQNIAS
jgi:Chlorophyll A-B binding protein